MDSILFRSSCVGGVGEMRRRPRLAKIFVLILHQPQMLHPSFPSSLACLFPTFNSRANTFVFWLDLKEAMSRSYGLSYALIAQCSPSDCVGIIVR